MADGVWQVTGIQAAGKSTVAELLARGFERGIHVRGGQFYRWAVRGWSRPLAAQNVLTAPAARAAASSAA